MMLSQLLPTLSARISAARPTLFHEQVGCALGVPAEGGLR